MSGEQIGETTARVKAATAEKPVERLLTLQQCREAAGVSRWTIWSWINERGLRTVKIGGVVRIREGDWQQFLAKHTKGNDNGATA